jgi:predicted XRE-type DNA-binding protein
VSSTSPSSKRPSTSSTASKRKPKRLARPISTSRPRATKKPQLDPEDLAIDGPYETVWDAIEDDPAERERLIVLANLSIALELEIRKRGWTQKEAAKHLGVTQPRISDLVRGKLSVFSIDALVGMLGAAGVRIDMSYRPVPPPPPTKYERAAA